MLFRLVAPSTRRLIVQTPARTRFVVPTFARQARLFSEHHEETFEEFTTRFEKEFDEAPDLFDVQRVLNNAFSYDLVPAPSVVEKALQAARRVNDYPTAVRVFEALKFKVENEEQYKEYLKELEPIRKELGVDLSEDLFASSAVDNYITRYEKA